MSTKPALVDKKIAPTKAKPAQLTCIDLFAGCGGLSLGLEQAGFHPLLFSELNKSASQTYVANRPGLDIVAVGDIHELETSSLLGLKKSWANGGIKDVDLVCGGPPCQGYSGIGHRRTFKLDKEEIPSNHLYQEMIRVIEAVRPRMFLFENVKGLLSSRWTPEGEKGEIWRDVLAAFQAIEGYEARFALVHAKDYGVPQNRPRVLLAGIRSDLGWRPELGKVADGLLPQPTGGYPTLEEAWGDLVDPDYLAKPETLMYPSAIASEFQERMRTLPGGRKLRKGDPLHEQEYSQHSDFIREKYAHMLAHDGEIPEKYRTKKFAQRVLQPRWDAEGPNITATSLPEDYVHYCQPRSITVREWARLQCFPDWYKFMGPRTTGGRRRAGDPSEGIWDREVPKYTQIGNAVPVKLAHEVGKHLRKFLA